MQRTAIILACFFICTNCFAQQYPFVHYTPKDGLVNSRVKKAYQDSKGRIYFLTWSGLSVFDGARFKNYTTQNGLASNILNDILEIGDDSLLIATNTRTLNALVKGKMIVVPTSGDPCPLINQFYRHDDGKIYLASDDGLFSLHNNKITTLNISILTAASSEAPNLGNISGYGNYLLLTTNEMKGYTGLFLYDIISNRICDTIRNPTTFILGKNNVNWIWISTNHKLFIVDSAVFAKGKISLISPPGNFKIMENLSLGAIAFDRESVWFVGRDENFINKDIRRIDKSGSIFSIPLQEQASSQGIRNILVDREKTIWVSTDGEGMFKIVNSPLLIFKKPFNSQRQIDKAFYSNNVTWFANYGFDDKSNKLFRRSASGVEVFDCNLGNAPIIFYADNNRLLAYDFEHIYTAGIKPLNNIIDFREIISLTGEDNFAKQLMTAGNAIIASQRSGLGIWKNNELVFHVPIPRNDNIEGISFDKKNLLWVLRRHGGINVFKIHPDDNSSYLEPAFTFAKEQLSGSPRCFIIDKTGTIWIGTRESGLVGYKQVGARLNKQYHFYTGNGLTDDFVTSIACDSLNNIIVGTQTGLDRIIYDSGIYHRVENLSKSRNFFDYINQTWTDSSHAYALTKSGVFLQVSYPSKENNIVPPQLLLEEIKVNAQAVLTGKIKFRYKENNISFFAAAPSFIDEKQVVYTYLLDGSGNDRWSDTATANSVINLTNLSAGKYNLKLKAFFPSNIYSPSELSYSFTIMPPWWQTWWFRSIVALLIVSILIIAFRFYYRRKLERRMVILEKRQAIEKERTRIATDMHDDLGAGLSRIKFLSETIGMKRQQQQPIEADVNKIREYSHEMIDKMGEIVWALNEKNDTLSDLLSYTRAYAVEYLSHHGIECLVESPHNFPSEFVSGEFRRNVFLTIKEALHNVVKHSRATAVTLAININHHLSISLQDNGTGFDRNSIRSFSNGISNMHIRIKEIGGKFEIVNKNGTLIKLSIPLNT